MYLSQRKSAVNSRCVWNVVLFEWRHRLLWYRFYIILLLSTESRSVVFFVIFQYRYYTIRIRYNIIYHSLSLSWPPLEYFVIMKYWVIHLWLLFTEMWVIAVCCSDYKSIFYQSPPTVIKMSHLKTPISFRMTLKFNLNSVLPHSYHQLIERNSQTLKCN